MSTSQHVHSIPNAPADPQAFGLLPFWNKNPEQFLLMPLWLAVNTAVI